MDRWLKSQRSSTFARVSRICFAGLLITNSIRWLKAADTSIFGCRRAIRTGRRKRWSWKWADRPVGVARPRRGLDARAERPLEGCSYRLRRICAARLVVALFNKPLLASRMVGIPIGGRPSSWPRWRDLLFDKFKELQAYSF